MLASVYTIIMNVLFFGGVSGGILLVSEDGTQMIYPEHFKTYKINNVSNISNSDFDMIPSGLDQ